MFIANLKNHVSNLTNRVKNGYAVSKSVFNELMDHEYGRTFIYGTAAVLASGAVMALSRKYMASEYTPAKCIARFVAMGIYGLGFQCLQLAEMEHQRDSLRTRVDELEGLVMPSMSEVQEEVRIQ